MKNQKKCPKGHQKTPKCRLKPPPGHQFSEKVEKVKPLKNHSFYYGYSTYSHRILAPFPSLNHQKHGPGTSLPFWHPKSLKIHKKETPKISLKSLKRTLGPASASWVTPWIPRSPKWCPRYPKWSVKVSK